MKTKLLKKWRQEAVNRIGVFETADGTFSVVFDKSFYGYVSDWREDYSEKYKAGYQIINSGIKTLEEARVMCDGARRIFILREARKEWRERYYGSEQRYY